MFDFFRSQAKAVRYLLGALMLVVALSMLTYLIPGGLGSGGSGGSADDQTVAQIGSDYVVTTQDVQTQVQSLMQQHQVPEDMLSVYLPTLVEQMVTERAVAYEAQRMGLKVSDAELATAIQSIGGGQFSDPAAYQRFVEQAGYTIPQFENNMRQQMLLTRLRDIVLAGVVATPAEVEAEYKKRNAKAKLEYIAFSPVEMKTKVESTPAELQAYFNSHRGLYTIPESRNADLIVIDEAKVDASIQVPDTQLRQYYSAHLDSYRVPERVQVRHILIKTTGKTPAEVATLKAKAEDILKQLKSGADFATLAKKYSEDTGSGAKGGELGWITRGQTVKSFEDAAFSLKPHVLSNLITTEYGFHIIEVEARQDAHTQSFDEVKDAIATEMKKSQVYDKMQNLADQAHAALVKAPTNAQQIAQQLGVDYFQAQKISASSPLPGIGVDANVGGAISVLKKGEVSDTLQAGASKLVLAAVTGVFPPHPAEFADAQAQVRETYAQEKAVQMVGEKSKQAAHMLQKNGGDMNAAAKSLGLTVKTTDDFTSNGAAEGIGSAVYLGDAFTKPVGSVIGPINVGSQTVVAKILQRTPADMSKFAAQRDDLMGALKNKRAQERVTLFEDSVLTKLIQEGKVKIHRDVIKRLVTSYQRS